MFATVHFVTTTKEEDDEDDEDEVSDLMGPGQYRGAFQEAGHFSHLPGYVTIHGNIHVSAIQ